MYVIFIVDSNGVAEQVAHTAHMRINALREMFYAHEEFMSEKLRELEGQAAAVELAVRTLADNPLNPASAARKAREILALLEG